MQRLAGVQMDGECLVLQFASIYDADAAIRQRLHWGLAMAAGAAAVEVRVEEYQVLSEALPDSARSASCRGDHWRPAALLRA